jgi:hypothetical protein
VSVCHTEEPWTERLITYDVAPDTGIQPRSALVVVPFTVNVVGTGPVFIKVGVPRVGGTMGVPETVDVLGDGVIVAVGVLMGRAVTGAGVSAVVPAGTWYVNGVSAITCPLGVLATTW